MDLLTDPNTWRIALELAAIVGLGVTSAKYKTLYRIIVAMGESIAEQLDGGEVIKKSVKSKTEKLGIKPKLDKILEKEGIVTPEV